MSWTPIAFLLLAGCSSEFSWDPSLVFNPSLAGWCDGAPCGWEVVGGTVVQKPSWHEDSGGVELRDGASLLQRRAVEWGWVGPNTCLDVAVVVDGAPDLTLEVDLQDDGHVELSAPIEEDQWGRQTFSASAPGWYDRIRIELRHGGGGGPHTVGLVAVEATRNPDCANAFTPQPLGAACEEDGHCGSGRCLSQADVPEWWMDGRVAEGVRFHPDTCGGCRSDADCGTDEICGSTWSDAQFFHQDCVPIGAGVVGEACSVDAQCDSGTCCNGRCSECCDATTPCDGDGQCEARALRGESETRIVAAVCDVGPRAVGAACFDHVDCPTACVGPPLRLCARDGRTCDSDLDCYDPSAGSCLSVGVRNGTCE